MVIVKTRYNGQGMWYSVNLPVSVQVGHTLEKAAKALNLGDQVQVVASGDIVHPLDLHA